MATINRAAKEISVKVVYYGPGLCGKTTNLQHIFDTANPDKRGKLLSVATETDRTLFFDFLPIDLGTVRGLKLKVGLYTVPGQVFYDATRRLVLRGADGVVFVADSQPAMLDNNLESLENLKTNLRLNNLDPDSIPLVIQFNKRDLPNALDELALNEALNWRRVPVRLASAAKGMGVHDTLKEVVKQVMASLNDKVDNAGGTVSVAPMPAAAPAAPTPPVTPVVAPPAAAAAPAPPAPAAPAIAPPAPISPPSPPAVVVSPPPSAAAAVPAPPLTLETMAEDEPPPQIEDAPILALPDAEPPPPPRELAGATLAARVPDITQPVPVMAPDGAVAAREEILRSRLQMLENHLSALDAVVAEIRAELAALKRL